MKWAIILTKILIVSNLVFTYYNPQLLQTLSWGVDEGDTFSYALQRKYIDTSDLDWAHSALSSAPFLALLEEGQIVNMTVTLLEAIPSIINATDDVPLSYCTLTRENEPIGLSKAPLLFVIPVDVWSLSIDLKRYSERLLNTYHGGGDTIYANDSDDTWTLTNDYWHGQKPIYFGIIQLQFYKETGILKSLWFQETLPGRFSDTILWDMLFVHWTSGMPTIVPLTSFPFIGLIAAIAVSFVVVLVVILVKYRSRIGL